MFREDSKPLGRWSKRCTQFGVKKLVNQDFKDLFRILNEETVKYLVVGAYAVTFHSEPRYTKDLDIWISRDSANAKRVWAALSRFGAPLSDISMQDFTDPDMVYQIGIEPNRIDIIMEVCGSNFADAWKNRVTSSYSDEPIALLSLDDLILAKKAAGRPQDLLDVEQLEKIKQAKEYNK